jgi:phage portal protein BeeE
VGKGKRRDRQSKAALSVVEGPAMAERHTFSNGLLGHDLTASAWLVNVSEQTSLGVDAVYNCVQIIADAMAGADVGEWRGSERLTPESRLVRRPYAGITRREWLWRMGATLALYNVAYTQDIGTANDGSPLSIRLLVPGSLSRVGHDVLVNGVPVNPETIRTWRRAYWPTLTAEIGSVLALARESFAAAMAADAYRSDFWQQGGAPVVVLTTDQKMTNDEAVAMSDRWVDRRTTSPGKPAVLSQGATAKGLGADLGTAGANESGDKLRASIARFFGMPADMINAPSEAGSLTYSTTEQHGLRLVRFTLGGFADTIADSWSEILPGDGLQGRRVRLGLHHLTMAEQLSRFQSWQIALDAPGHPGWMTAAEIREAEGLPPDLALPSAGTPAPALESIPAAAPALRDSEMQTTDLAGTMELRDAAQPGDGRSVSGVAVPYGQSVSGSTREFGRAEERFAPGSFRDAIEIVNGGRRLPIVDEHQGTVVGYADHLEDHPDGLHYFGRLLEVPEAAPFAARVAARVLGVSIEFIPGEIRRFANGVIHTRVSRLGAIAGSYAPGYVGSTISVRSAGGISQMYCQHCGAELVANTPCSCFGATAERAAAPSITQIAPATRDASMPPVHAGPLNLSPEAVARLATDATEEYMRTWAERNAGGMTGPRVDPFADLRGYRTLGHLMQAAGAEGAPNELRTYAARALADQLTTDSNEGVLTPGVLPEIHGIVSRGRPAITAFGGPRALTGQGMSVDWAYFDGTLSSLVGAQGTQKTAITTAKVQIKKGTEAIQTFAGGSDIALQLIRRSSPSYLDTYARVLLTAWGVVTDAAFVAELETGSVTGDFTEALSTVDATELKNLLIDASIAVETATGQPAEFVLASTTAFTAAAKLLTPVTSQPAQAAAGVVDLRALRVNIGNLPIIHVPSVTAGKFIASNASAAGWFEEGPFQIQDVDVNLLGLDVAYWSLGVPARFIPAGIVEIYDVTP